MMYCSVSSLMWSGWVSWSWVLCGRIKRTFSVGKTYRCRSLDCHLGFQREDERSIFFQIFAPHYSLSTFLACRVRDLRILWGLECGEPRATPALRSGLPSYRSCTCSKLLDLCFQRSWISVSSAQFSLQLQRLEVQTAENRSWREIKMLRTF